MSLPFGLENHNDRRRAMVSLNHAEQIQLIEKGPSVTDEHQVMRPAVPFILDPGQIPDRGHVEIVDAQALLDFAGRDGIVH